MTKLIKVLLLSTIIFSASVQSAVPSDSIYQLDSVWQNQDAQPFSLKDLTGKKVLLSMVYTHCEHTCPAIVSTMKMVQKSLSKTNQDNAAYVLVSLTPESDTESVLKEFAKQYDIDSADWTLLRGNSTTVRELAMALGIKYQKLEDKQVNHSNLISILDTKGRLSLQAPGFPSEVEKISTHLINNEK